MGSTTWPNSGKPLTIRYNDKRSLEFFLNTPIVDDEDAAPEVKTKNIPIHPRRKGPSDQTPINVESHPAEYLKDPTLKSGNARPGRSFILQTTDDADVDEKRQFTFTGRTMDLRQILAADIKYPTYLYVQGGGRKTLNPIIGDG